MRKKVVEQVDATHWDIVCDLCGRKDFTPTPQHSYRQCKCCKRDMCMSCQRSDYYWSDDRPDLYCIDCYGNGEHYRMLRDLEAERHAEKLEDIQKRWYADAKQYVHDKEKEKDV